MVNFVEQVTEAYAKKGEDISQYFLVTSDVLGVKRLSELRDRNEIHMAEPTNNLLGPAPDNGAGQIVLNGEFASWGVFGCRKYEGDLKDVNGDKFQKPLLSLRDAYKTLDEAIEHADDINKDAIRSRCIW